SSAGKIQADLVILSVNLREPVGGFDDLQLAVDIYLSKLVNQNNRGIAERRRIPYRDLDLQPLLRSVARFLHQLPGFSPVLGDIRIVSGQGPEDLFRHAPNTLGRWLHGMKRSS